MVRHPHAGFYVYPNIDTLTNVGNIIIDGDTLRRDDLRKALNMCFGSGVIDKCWVNISGTPFKGSLGYLLILARGCGTRIAC